MATVTMRMHRNNAYFHEGDEHTRKRWTITVQDESSGITLAEFEMTDAQWASWHGPSGAANVEANLVPQRAYHRIGKTGWVASILLDNDYDGQGYHRSDVRLGNLAESASLAQEVGAEKYSVSKRNNGLALLVRGYADTQGEAMEAARRAADNLSEFARNNEWKLRAEPHWHPSLLGEI